MLIAGICILALGVSLYAYGAIVHTDSGPAFQIFFLILILCCIAGGSLIGASQHHHNHASPEQVAYRTCYPYVVKHFARIDDHHYSFNCAESDQIRIVKVK